MVGRFTFMALRYRSLTGANLFYFFFNCGWLACILPRFRELVYDSAEGVPLLYSHQSSKIRGYRFELRWNIRYLRLVLTVFPPSIFGSAIFLFLFFFAFACICYVLLCIEPLYFLFFQSLTRSKSLFVEAMHLPTFGV